MTNCLSCQFTVPGLWSMVRTSDDALLNPQNRWQVAGGMLQLTFFLSLGVSFSSLCNVKVFLGWAVTNEPRESKMHPFEKLYMAKKGCE